MARDLDRLARRMLRHSKAVETGVRAYVAGVTGSIAEVLVPATPVDTGLARGNWRASIGAPVTRPVTLLDKTGAASVSHIKLVGQQYRLGSTIFITNNVPYINALNGGSSPQAPAGFIEASVREGVERANRRFAVRLTRV